MIAAAVIKHWCGEETWKKQTNKLREQVLKRDAAKKNAVALFCSCKYARVEEEITVHEYPGYIEPS